MLIIPQMKVKPEDIKPGDKYEGYETETLNSSCTIIVDENGVPKEWGTDEIKHGPILYFLRPRTWQEKEDWKKNKLNMSYVTHQNNLLGLHHDLYDVGDAYHEMYNGWVDCEWRDLLLNAEDENIFIVGVAPAPYGCISFNEPVAIVAESKFNGERFWCHAEKDWIDDMRENSMDEYNKIMEEYKNAGI